MSCNYQKGKRLQLFTNLLLRHLKRHVFNGCNRTHLHSTKWMCCTFLAALMTVINRIHTCST